MLMATTGTVVMDVFGSTTYRAPRFSAALRMLRRERRAARSPELHGVMELGSRAPSLGLHDALWRHSLRLPRATSAPVGACTMH